MTRTVYPTNQFKRDLKRHYLELLTPTWVEAFHCLLNDKELPAKYVNHPLRGDYQGCMDCHIKPDLVLIYEKQGNDLILHRLGSHSQLFG